MQSQDDIVKLYFKDMFTLLWESGSALWKSTKYAETTVTYQ